MKKPPLARGAARVGIVADRSILTGFGLWRVIFVGLALLIYTLWAFFWMASPDVSDELARTVAVNAITIGQVFYLLNCRYLVNSSMSIDALLGNRYLPLGIGAVVVLQILFTYAPPLPQNNNFPFVARASLNRAMRSGKCAASSRRS
jgi:magnesium-transporting ATPase (P-type)